MKEESNSPLRSLGCTGTPAYFGIGTKKDAVPKSTRRVGIGGEVMKKKVKPVYHGFQFLDEPRCYFEQVSGEVRPIWQIVKYNGARWEGKREVVVDVTLDGSRFGVRRPDAVEAIASATVYDFLERHGVVALECGDERQPDGSLRHLVCLDYARIYEMNKEISA